ncbi:Fanconi anemia group D2 protein [Galdieria sulphuraria]|nr:Fanconi anemia group D2 protein [Galdieria sulphuraria]
MYHFLEQLPIEDDYSAHILSTCFSNSGLKIFRISSEVGKLVYGVYDISEFRQELLTFLKNEQERLDEFVSELSRAWDKTSIFERSLDPLIRIDLQTPETDCNPQQFISFDSSLIRVLTTLPPIQENLFNILILKLSEWQSSKMKSYQQPNSHAATIQEKILEQLCFQPVILQSSTLARSLVELISVSSDSLQYKLLFRLPDILDEEGQELASSLLLKIIPHSPHLLNQALEAFSCMSLSHEKVSTIVKQLCETGSGLSIKAMLDLILMVPEPDMMTHVLRCLQRSCIDFVEDSSQMYAIIKNFTKRAKSNATARKNILKYYRTKGDKLEELDYFLLFLLYSAGEKRFVLHYVFKKNWKLGNQPLFSSIYNIIKLYPKFSHDLCSLLELAACDAKEALQGEQISLMFVTILRALKCIDNGPTQLIECIISSLVRLVERHPSVASDIGLFSLLYISRNWPELVETSLRSLQILWEYLEVFDETNLRCLFEVSVRVLQRTNLRNMETCTLSSLAILLQKDLCHIDERIRKVGIIGACANLELIPSLFSENQNNSKPNFRLAPLFINTITPQILREFSYFVSRRLFSVETVNKILSSSLEVFERHFSVERRQKIAEASQDDLSSSCEEQDDSSITTLILKNTDIDLWMGFELYRLIARCSSYERVETNALAHVVSILCFDPMQQTVSEDTLKHGLFAAGFARISIAEMANNLELISLHFKEFRHIVQILVNLEAFLSSALYDDNHVSMKAVWKRLAESYSIQNFIDYRQILPNFSFDTLHRFCQAVFKAELRQNMDTLIACFHCFLIDYRRDIESFDDQVVYDKFSPCCRYHSGTFCLVTLLTLLTYNNVMQPQKDSLLMTTLHLACETCSYELRNKNALQLLMVDDDVCLHYLVEANMLQDSNDALHNELLRIEHFYHQLFSLFLKIWKYAESNCLAALIELLNIIWKVHPSQNDSESCPEIESIIRLLEERNWVNQLNMEHKERIAEILLKNSKTEFFQVLSHSKALFEGDDSTCFRLISELGKVLASIDRQKLKEMLLRLSLEHLEMEVKKYQACDIVQPSQHDWIQTLSIFSLVFLTFQHMLQEAKEKASLKYLGFCLKWGRKLVAIILDGGLQLLTKELIHDKAHAIKLFKELQKCTRSIHQICLFCKETKTESLLLLLPPVKKQLEMLIFRVKEMLQKQGLAHLFWLGNLKNKNLQALRLKELCMWREPTLITLFFLSSFTWLVARSLVALAWIIFWPSLTLYTFWVLVSACFEELARYVVYKTHNQMNSALCEYKNSRHRASCLQLEGFIVGTSFAVSGFFAGAGTKLIHLWTEDSGSFESLSSDSLATILCIYSVLLSDKCFCLVCGVWQRTEIEASYKCVSAYNNITLHGDIELFSLLIRAMRSNVILMRNKLVRFICFIGDSFQSVIFQDICKRF